MDKEKVEEVKEKATGLFNKAKEFVMTHKFVFIAAVAGFVLGLVVG